MSGKKRWLVKLTFYMFLRNSALREINKYSVNIQIIYIYIYKINTLCETHKFLIIVDNISKEKARFKRQREKKLEITRGTGCMVITS